MSIVNMLIATMMGALGVLVLLRYTFGGDLSRAFLAVYMVLFASLLFVYELMWWTALPKLNKAVRLNFGFMYGIRGKGFYLVFVAFLCLGLGNHNTQMIKTLAWATGIAHLVVGCLHVFVACMKPDLSIQYRAPTAGLSAGAADDNDVI